MDQTLRPDGKLIPAHPILPLKNGSPGQSLIRTAALYRDRPQRGRSSGPQRWVIGKWTDGPRTKRQRDSMPETLVLPFVPTQEDMSRLQGINPDTITNKAVNTRSFDHKDEPTRH